MWVQPCRSDTPITHIGDHRVNVGIFVQAIIAKPDLTQGRYVLAEVGTSKNSGVLGEFGKVTGFPVQYLTISVEEYDQLFPNWGQEMGVMLQFWEEAGNKSWSKKGVTPLRKEDLDIAPSSLVGLEATLRKDWVH